VHVSDLPGLSTPDKRGEGKLAVAKSRLDLRAALSFDSDIAARRRGDFGACIVPASQQAAQAEDNVRHMRPNKLFGADAG